MAIFSGTMMNDILVGTIEDDVLWGGMGDDDLSGGGGNDRLEGGPGADNLDGGPGTMDVASYRNSDDGVKVDLSDSFVEDDDDPGPVFGGHAEGDSLRGIEGLWGSDFSDKLLGNHTANYIFGFDGNDIIMGARGNDLLRGQDGDDEVVGEWGDDTLYGDAGGDLLQGGPGNDLLRGGEGIDVLEGGMGDDVLEGGADGDELNGGYDAMDAEGNITNGGSDTASYRLSPEAVMVDLRYPDHPAAQAPMGGDAEGDMLDGIENLRGSMHDDVLIGDGGKNKLFGNMGDDMLKGMGEADTLHGGKGMDTLYGGDGNDILRGEMGDDALKGEDGSDTLVGGPGADKLFGGMFDAETMMPGEDDQKVGGIVILDGKAVVIGDTADYSGSDEGVHVSLTPMDHDKDRETPDNIIGEGGHAEGDELVAIENLTGSDHTDMLKGSSPSEAGEKDGNNLLKGGAGDDWDAVGTTAVEGGLFGMGGDDTLSGGDGMDLLDGGDGIDDLWGDAGDDLIKGGAGDDFSSRLPTADDATATPPITPDIDRDGDGTADAVGVAVTYPDITKVPEANGGPAADGTPGTFMRAGLYGGAGNDTLIGGAGADYLDGGAGNDTASYAGSAAVTVNLGGAAAAVVNAGGDAEGDVLKNIENITGGTNGDILHGNAKANVLTGGGGGDSMTGYGGADTFVFTDDPAISGLQVTGTATITDFSSRDGDKIDLSAFSLSNQELIDMLDEAGVTADGTTVSLDLGDAGDAPVAGTFEVIVEGRDLDVDDFII